MKVFYTMIVWNPILEEYVDLCFEMETSSVTVRLILPETSKNPRIELSFPKRELQFLAEHI